MLYLLMVTLALSVAGCRKNSETEKKSFCQGGAGLAGSGRGMQCFLIGLFGEKEGFGVLLAATVGVPLYACGGGIIPLLIQWLSNGTGGGSVCVTRADFQELSVIEDETKSDDYF